MLQALEPWITRLRQAGSLYVGYSGGLDSHVLLHLLSRQFNPEHITAIHVHHGLSPNADKWMKHCVQQCQKLRIWCYTEKVSVNQDAGSLEAAAREARYRVFENQLGEGDVLLLGHHADDSIETFLYNLLRGTGPKGLAGIPPTRALGQGDLVRPLLPYSRRDLQRYAMKHNLVWIDDESNRDTRFDRNFVRHYLTPMLAERWPDYRERIRHSAELCNESFELSQQLAAIDLEASSPERTRHGWRISLKAVQQLNRARQANLLRYWTSEISSGSPGHRVVEAILNTLIAAREDAMPQVSWGDHCMRRYREWLYLLPAELPAVNPEKDFLVWSPNEPQSLPDGAVIRANKSEGRGIYLPDGERFVVRFRQGGERCQPSGRNHSNTLKKLFQEFGLEPWLRERVPLIYIGDEMVAVGDIWINAGYEARPGEAGWELNWQPF